MYCKSKSLCENEKLWRQWIPPCTKARPRHFSFIFLIYFPSTRNLKSNFMCYRKNIWMFVQMGFTDSLSKLDEMFSKPTLTKSIDSLPILDQISPMVFIVQLRCNLLSIAYYLHRFTVHLKREHVEAVVCPVAIAVERDRPRQSI